MIIRRRNPKAKNICAVFINNILRINAVSERFRHFFAFSVNCPAVCNDFLERCTAAACNRCKQGRLEPASVLIRTLKINICRHLKIIPVFAYCGMGWTRIKPYIHNIGFFIKALCFAAVGAFEALRQEIFGIMRKPCVRTFFAEDFGNLHHNIIINNFFSACLAVNHRNRNAPFSLAGNAPVGTLSYHGLQSVLTPFGEPSYILGCLYCGFLEIINRAEPLWGGTENNRLMTSPAMRILMHNFLKGKQISRFLKMLRNRLVCFFCGKPGKLPCFFC